MLRMVFLRERVVTIFELFDGLRSVGTRLRHYADPSSSKKNVAVSPSITIRMGENVKPRCLTFE